MVEMLRSFFIKFVMMMYFIRALTCSGAKLKERMEQTMIDIMIFNRSSKIGVGDR